MKAVAVSTLRIALPAFVLILVALAWIHNGRRQAARREKEFLRSYKLIQQGKTVEQKREDAEKAGAAYDEFKRWAQTERIKANREASTIPLPAGPVSRPAGR